MNAEISKNINAVHSNSATKLHLPLPLPLALFRFKELTWRDRATFKKMSVESILTQY